MDPLASLPEADRQLALQRFQVLQPHLEQGRPLREVARDAGVPYRTAQRWVSLYQKFGLVALARRPRADRGKRRRLSDRMRQVVEGLALQKPPLPITTLYRQVARIAREQGEPEPSYAVVYDVVRGLPADLVMLAHEGGKAYGDVYELVHRREADRPNALWQADHTPLDIELVRDVTMRLIRLACGHFLVTISPRNGGPRPWRENNVFAASAASDRSGPTAT